MNNAYTAWVTAGTYGNFNDALSIALRKKKADALRKREEAKRKAEEDKHARESLLARLTPEEKRLLGVK